jgi:hypothetical protein
LQPEQVLDRVEGGNGLPFEQQLASEKGAVQGAEGKEWSG